MQHGKVRDNLRIAGSRRKEVYGICFAHRADLVAILESWSLLLAGRNFPSLRIVGAAIVNVAMCPTEICCVTHGHLEVAEVRIPAKRR